ncbi:hypothetical protein HBI56_043070 [Parastagonospora nodorum]|uniref:Copper transporter n=1 Tax=Phaeosphaeria nodorum (strain SN15 / ATCC MYA-4574 / FGSC 10173) TaxID=321614 RepID=A0A7U2HWD8_PHANO|nr:hypothetical protein HBH54_084400 [Parastagonospora nodorum]QRC93133.1 hypothetical protein JI435_428920 [Parastagonospora nodorum SN15]KAH4004975.1 hypothetical protein HBI10_046370 [Parastagonospora nodorum]KAH4031176.1 hypothetical protein HBI13_029820 [Parastagonospora nodorum]KAH4334733.1 hypothetical protein HBI00_030110 [Parastagonospora nodorum]
MQILIILLHTLDLAEAVLSLCLALVWLLLAAYETLTTTSTTGIPHCGHAPRRRRPQARARRAQGKDYQDGEGQTRAAREDEQGKEGLGPSSSGVPQAKSPGAEIDSTQAVFPVA